MAKEDRVNSNIVLKLLKYCKILSNQISFQHLLPRIKGKIVKYLTNFIEITKDEYSFDYTQFKTFLTEIANRKYKQITNSDGSSLRNLIELNLMPHYENVQKEDLVLDEILTPSVLNLLNTCTKHLKEVN